MLERLIGQTVELRFHRCRTGRWCARCDRREFILSIDSEAPDPDKFYICQVVDENAGMWEVRILKEKESVLPRGKARKLVR
jgi:hypothetical protein